MPTTKYVKKAFTLQHDGEKHDFAVGEVLPAKFHDHWYAQAHTSDQPVAADAGASAAADELLAELEGKAKELQARENHLAGMEKAMADHMTDLTAREEALATRVSAADQRETDLNGRAEALDAREVAIAEREKVADAAAKQTGKK